MAYLSIRGANIRYAPFLKQRWKKDEEKDIALTNSWVQGKNPALIFFLCGWLLDVVGIVLWILASFSLQGHFAGSCRPEHSADR